MVSEQEEQVEEEPEDHPHTHTLTHTPSHTLTHTPFLALQPFHLTDVLSGHEQ